jgi:hypothetical protein
MGGRRFLFAISLSKFPIYDVVQGAKVVLRILPWGFHDLIPIWPG